MGDADKPADAAAVFETPPEDTPAPVDTLATDPEYPQEDRPKEERAAASLPESLSAAADETGEDAAPDPRDAALVYLARQIGPGAAEVVGRILSGEETVR